MKQGAVLSRIHATCKGHQWRSQGAEVLAHPPPEMSEKIEKRAKIRENQQKNYIIFSLTIGIYTCISIKIGTFLSKCEYSVEK
jgi:hypothetical protein